MDVDEPWQPVEGAGIESPRQGAWDDVPVMGMIPDVGKAELVPQNQNAAQAWKQNPGNLGGAAQVQQRNREMLKPKTDTTSRYYTRQLYREMTKSRDPETRMQGRLGLRIRGADPNAGRDQMVSNRTALGQRVEGWRDIFPQAPDKKAVPEMEGIGWRGQGGKDFENLFPKRAGEMWMQDFDQVDDGRGGISWRPKNTPNASPIFDPKTKEQIGWKVDAKAQPKIDMAKANQWLDDIINRTV